MNNLLLQTCCFEPEVAFEIYQRWKLQIDFDQLNPNEFSLLPLLYQHLKSYLNDPLTPRLVGIYKQAWVLQQQRIHQQQLWQQRLEQHRIIYTLLDDARLHISATPDFAIQSINGLLSITPSNDWLMSKQKYLLHWKIRGWVTFKHSTRVFRQACPELILHRLEYSRFELVWLSRAMPELQSISDWQAFFATAQKFGLCKRLYDLLEPAQKMGLLQLVPLPTQFSHFDQNQSRLVQNQSGLFHVWYAYLIQMQKRQSNT